MSMYKTIIISLFSLIYLSTFARADFLVFKPDDDEGGSVKVAKVFYVGEVNEGKVSELISILDRINGEYKALEKIYLYISSGGGDMDSGQMAYWAIRSSRTPVTTVNISRVQSAASLMFCGAQERLALPGTTFMLHPASINGPGENIQPDNIDLLKQSVDLYNGMFKNIYGECTDIPGKEISSLLYSEDQRLLLTHVEAQEKGMVTGLAPGIVDAPVSYLIESDGS